MGPVTYLLWPEVWDELDRQMGVLRRRSRRQLRRIREFEGRVHD